MSVPTTNSSIAARQSMHAVCIIIATLCSFSSSRAADISLAKTTASVNGPIAISIKNARQPSTTKDWVGLYESSATPGGGPVAIWWAYLLDLGVTDGNGSFVFDPAAIDAAQASRYTAGNTYSFIVAYNDSYTIEADVDFSTTAPQAPLITSFNQCMATTAVGVAPDLPPTVTAQNGSSFPVVWDAIPSSSYTTPGSFTVRGLVDGCAVYAKADVTVEEENGPDVRFAVISDVHIRNNSPTDNHTVHFTNAMKDISAIHTATPLGAMCIAGDYTDNGSAANYGNFKTILNSVSHPPAFFAIGNHEIGSNYAVAAQRFLDSTNAPAIYYDTIINGYDFIFLGSDSGSSITFNLTPAQLSWLDNKLTAADDEGRFAFVIIHEPVSNTVAGSDEMQDIAQSNAFKAVVEKHENAIVFSGHTHYIETSANEFYNSNAHYVNTGSVGYLWYGPTWSGCGGSQGVYVDVYSDKVVIKCRDFEHREWIAASAGPGGGQEIILNDKTVATHSPIQSVSGNGIVMKRLGGSVPEINFSLDNEKSVTLSIYNLQGKLIAQPIAGEKLSRGAHTLPCDLGRNSRGMYSAVLTINGVVSSALFCLEK